jgi:hypothetical protein
MLLSVPSDILFVCAELMTGKSIPVLVGITTLPVGQGLAWISVTTGGIAGTCFSAWAARQTESLATLSFLNRLLQLSSSLVYSLSLLVTIAEGVHSEHGATLVLVPAFCIVCQDLPQRPSTALVAFLLAWGTFYICGIMTAIDASVPGTAATLEEALSHSKLGYYTSLHKTPEPALSMTLQEIVLRALQLFALGAYACMQHAPTQVFFDTHYKDAHSHPIYASTHYATHAAYSFFIAFFSAWLRVCVWTAVCFSQRNFLHLMLENSEREHWDPLCCSAYSVTLLYSACWNAVQIREQIMPRFHANTKKAALKFAVLILTVATILHQHPPQLMFYSVYALTAVSILTSLTTMRQTHAPHQKK